MLLIVLTGVRFLEPGQEGLPNALFPLRAEGGLSAHDPLHAMGTAGTGLDRLFHDARRFPDPQRVGKEDPGEPDQVHRTLFQNPDHRGLA